MELTKNEMSELNDLAWHWESAYSVGFEGGVFTAARMDGSGELLQGATPDGLRQRIIQDYAEWRVGLVLDRAVTE